MYKRQEKGRPEYRGVYQAINFCFAKYAAKNFVFINREQDADEEGLRQAKESYMPSGYLNKNTICIVKLYVSLAKYALFKTRSPIKKAVRSISDGLFYRS